MKKIFIPIAAVFSILNTQNTSAQNEVDAYNLSNYTPNSTALSTGMAGVGGSMGGDFNGLSINPAGIGVYRSGEFTLTPALKFSNTKSDFNNSNISKTNTDLVLNNLGLVFHKNLKGKWKSVSFGIGMNTLVDYNNKINSSGENDQSSISDIFAASAQAYGVEQNQLPPYGFLGYQGYLIDDNNNPIVPLSQGLVQHKRWENSGSAKEFVINVGGNYNEQLMLGLGVGVVSTSYERVMLFSEEDATNNPNNYFSYADLYEQVKTSGLGANVKLGAIYVPNRNAKIGVSLHTPTWSTMSDVMDYRLETNTESFKKDFGYTDTDPVSIAQPENVYQFDYGMRSPWKAVLSGTVFLGGKGLLSADYEFVDFSSMKYIMNDYKDYEQSVNQAIKDTYKPAHIFRIGGEAMLKNIFLRAGVAYHTNPYQNSNFGSDRLDLSAGAGLRFNQYFVDLGFMHTQSGNAEYLYNVSANNVYNPLITNKIGHNMLALTVGYKFRD